MSMYRWLFAVFAALVLCTGCKLRQEPVKRRGLDGLDWMVGSWASTDKRKRTSREEHWSRPHANLMLGLNRTVKRDKVVAREHQQILDTGAQMIYTVWPDGEEPTSFTVKGRGERRVIFENPANDFPQRVLYWRDDEGLHAQLDGTVHGKRQRSSWLWQRASGIPFLTAKRLDRVVEVPAPREEVWKAWTTSEGAKTFFAPEALIEARVGGRYELQFDPQAPKGSRGSECCVVVELDPPKNLAFTWSFPPSLPIRHAHTLVRVVFTSLGKGRTRVSLDQTGWQNGEEWDQGYAHFERAWTLVLNRLKQRFAKGPLDWSKVSRPGPLVDGEGAASQPAAAAKKAE